MCFGINADFAKSKSELLDSLDGNISREDYQIISVKQQKEDLIKYLMIG